MTIITLEEEVFHASPEEVAATVGREHSTTRSTAYRRKVTVGESSYGGLYVRRPTRGIQVTPNTYSTMRVLDAGGAPVGLINSSAPPNETKSADMSANYILQSVSESRDEKLQLLETFGQAYGFFFGERPRVVQFSGVLVNTADFNWRSEWWENYENIFRGTKLVERNARLYISYDDIVVEGYMLNSAIGQQAEANPNLVSLNFSMWVTGYHDSSDIGAAEFPGHSALRAAEDKVADIRSRRTQEIADALNEPYKVDALQLWTDPEKEYYQDADGTYYTVPPVSGTVYEGRDRDSIRSNIYDNVDEYVYGAGGGEFDAEAEATARQDQMWAELRQQGSTPENPTEVHDKSFGVLKKNLSGNLQGAMTVVGGQMLAANGEMSAGSVDDPPTHGAFVVRDMMLPTTTGAPREDNVMGGLSAVNPAL